MTRPHQPTLSGTSPHHLLPSFSQTNTETEAVQEAEPLDFDILDRIIISFELSDRNADVKTKDEEVFGVIVAHLNRLEGVDLEPDYIAKSASGPWEILVMADCANQFRAAYKNATSFQIIGVQTPIVIKYKTLDEKASELPQASSRALANAFKDVSAHLVVRNYKFEMKEHFSMNLLAKAVESQGFFFLQGNQERTKVVTPEGIIVTQGKKEVYHLSPSSARKKITSYDVDSNFHTLPVC